MKKKVILLIVASVAAVIVVCIALVVAGVIPLPQAIAGELDNADDELGEIGRISKLITKTHPTDIVVLGKEISFQVDVSTRKVDEATEENLTRKDGCKYTFFIINDLDNEVNLTDEEIAFIAEKINSENFCLAYLGEKYSTVWDDPEQYVANVEGNLWFRYNQVDDEPHRAIGAWNKEEQEQLSQYPYMLGDVVLYEIEAFLISLN